MSTVLEAAPVVVEPVRSRQPVARNVAVDAYRGFVMLLMMAEVLQFSRMSQIFPASWFWRILAFNQTHAEWAGCSLHDMIQPGFSFLVGVALPYSIACRMAKGGAFGRMFAHALWRALLLIALGIFLRSLHSPQTNFTFEDTLTQIGLRLRVPLPARVLFAALAMDRARRDSVGLLASLGLVPCAGSRIQLAGRGSAVGLDASLHGLGRALEQEQQFGAGRSTSGS